MDIKKVARAYGVTMVQVAEKMGISKGGLSQLINGNPTIASLRSIANAIGCEVGDFFADEVTEETQSEHVFRCPRCSAALKVKIEEVEEE